ncbi:putative 3',5'-cyclic phosphodiesterase pde-4, partial [Choanephora cucurbitarum]
MLKIVKQPYRYSLDYSLLNKQRAEVYGYIAGIFKKMGVNRTLGITTSEFLDFLIDVEKGYQDNPYHSFYHAVDVTMVLYHLLVLYDMSKYLNQFDLAMLMLAGICHDIGHPGNNNQFEISCETEKAKRFSNLSVLESYSAVMTLDLFDKHDFLRNIETRSKKISKENVYMTKDSFSSGVVKMILATDMFCHFTLRDNITALKDKIDHHHHHENQLKPLFDHKEDPYVYFKEHYFNSETPNSVFENDEDADLNQEQRLMMCNILIHAADISNPCRPWNVYQQLSRLVCLEFFRQGDVERELGLPVSPQMDRNKANPSKVNVGFIDFIVRPYFESLCQLFPKAEELVDRCDQNREEWVQLSWEEAPDPNNTNIPSAKESLGGDIEEEIKQM